MALSWIPPHGPYLAAMKWHPIISQPYNYLLFRFGDAAEKGIERALSSGCKKPLLYLVKSKNGPSFEKSNLVSILGALKALYVPLEMREGVPEKAVKLSNVGVFIGEDSDLASTLKLSSAIEDGKSICRDVGG